MTLYEPLAKKIEFLIIGLEQKQHKPFCFIKSNRKTPEKYIIDLLNILENSFLVL